MTNRGDAKKHFNEIHPRTRQTIERSFALLFGRFRTLKYLDMSRVDFIPSAVIGACVLHNLCRQDNIYILEEYISEGFSHVQGELNIRGTF